MRKKNIIIVSILAILIIIGTFFSIPIVKHWDCYSSGGKWGGFGSTLVDSCAAERAPSFSLYGGMAVTEGCDCGPKKCWEEIKNECVNNIESE